MKLFRRSADLREYMRSRRTNNRSVGFVPTMGALHAGHLSLIELSAAQNQQTVCSIFVNPTQFNDPADLAKYPRTPGRDLELLAAAGCQVTFLPSVEEVYPVGLDTSLDLNFSPLDTVMEGAERPGHFAGVAQVVHRLLELVRPDRLYLGQKDYQQVAIIQELLRQTESAVVPVVVPTVREADGLAMSSRNVRLTEELRAAAPAIYRALGELRTDLLAGTGLETARAAALRTLTDTPGLRPEYLSVFDGRSLQPIGGTEGVDSVVAAAAVWAGEVRLIDNIVVI
ncbi:MAG: pantoate--beta-alanine ligase [Saprospiraceae bacterium]